MLLVQIDAILETMALAQGRDLSEVCREVLEAGVANTFQVVRDFEARYGSNLIAERIAAVRPVIPIDAVARMVDAQNLLVRDLGKRIREGIASELGQSITQGEGIAKATRRLRQQLEAQDWQLERIARTEISNAMNVGHEAAIGQVAGSFPELDLKKQWSAHLDRRTSARCRGLDGDVVDHDANFHADDGWTGPYAPAHPNCRSRVVPYTDRWGGKRQRSPEEKARDEAAYQAQAAASKAARAEARAKARQEAKATAASKGKKPKKPKKVAPVAVPQAGGPGLPGVPLPPQKGGPAVANAIKVATSDPTSRAAQRALKVIDELHGDGVLPAIPFKVTAKGKILGGYGHNPYADTASHIELSRKGKTPELTMAHEVGHFLDHKALGGKGFATGTPGPDVDVDRVMAAIRASQAHAGLEQLKQGGPPGLPPGMVQVGHVEYLLEPHELWARAYAQWVATKSQDARMLAQLDTHLDPNALYKGRQWAHADFQPVLEAFDMLMENRGWTRT